MYNAESPTPVYICIDSPHMPASTQVPASTRGMYTIHLIGRPRCFVFDLSLNLRDSSTVKTKAYSNAFIVNASSTPPPLGLSADERYCKVTIFNITSRIILQLFSCSNWSILLWTHKVRRISKKMSTARGIRPGCLYNDDWCRKGKIRLQKQKRKHQEDKSSKKSRVT